MSGAPNPARKVKVVAGMPLMAAAFLVGLTVLTVFARPRHPTAARTPADVVAVERSLRFADRDDGAVIVTDGANGHQIAVVTGQNGFLRGTMSGLTRIRRTEGVGRAVPFKLTLYADHRLVLGDPTTGKTIELEAFGPTNEAVFANFLPAPRPG